MSALLRIFMVGCSILLLAKWSSAEGLYFHKGALPTVRTFTVELPKICSGMKSIRFFDLSGKELPVEVEISNALEVRLRSLKLSVKLGNDKKLHIKSEGISRSKVSEIAYIFNDVENVHEKWLLVLQPAVVMVSQSFINTNWIMEYKIMNLPAAEYVFRMLEHESPDATMYYEKQDMGVVARCKNIAVSGGKTTCADVTFICEPGGVTSAWMTEFRTATHRKIGKNRSLSPEKLKRRASVNRFKNAIVLCLKDMTGGNSYAKSLLEQFQRDVTRTGQVRTDPFAGLGTITSYADRAGLLRMARVFELSSAYLKKSSLDMSATNKTMERALKTWESEVKKKLPVVKYTSNDSRGGSRRGLHLAYALLLIGGVHDRSRLRRNGENVSTKDGRRCQRRTASCHDRSRLRRNGENFSTKDGRRCQRRTASCHVGHIVCGENRFLRELSLMKRCAMRFQSIGTLG